MVTQQVLAECAETLWQPKYAKVLAYLHSRGLADETIRHFRLGYCACGKDNRYRTSKATAPPPSSTRMP